MNAQEIIDYIANSEKKTPVKVYVNTTAPVDFGSAKVFGGNNSFTVFGDWNELQSILEECRSRGVKISLAGIQPDVEKMLDRVGIHYKEYSSAISAAKTIR